MRKILVLIALVSSLSAQPPVTKKAAVAPPIVPTAEELALIRGKVDELDKMLPTRKAGADLIADVEVYAKAGRFLLEFPQTFYTLDGIRQAIGVMDEGLSRARQPQNTVPAWKRWNRNLSITGGNPIS